MSAPTPILTQPDTPSEIWNAIKAKSQDCAATKKNLPTVEISPPQFSQRVLSAPPGETELPPMPGKTNFQNPASAPAQFAIPLAQIAHLSPESTPELMAFSGPTNPRPGSNSQLYRQRLEALSAGQTYTRLSPDSFWSSWEEATEQPTYDEWIYLLEDEAGAMARGQGSNRLSILVGDSLSLWFPCDRLPIGRLWLNQGISGDTTAGILERLFAFSATKPQAIYLMAGINDLRQGKSDSEILQNLRQIIHRLREQHPSAEVIVQSILPTRLSAIPNSRIRNINQQLVFLAQSEGARYLDIHTYFTDEQGSLRWELTTDGLHLNPRGYAVWQWALDGAESWLTLNRIR